MVVHDRLYTDDSLDPAAGMTATNSSLQPLGSLLPLEKLFSLLVVGFK